MFLKEEISRDSFPLDSVLYLRCGRGLAGEAVRRTRAGLTRVRVEGKTPEHLKP